MVCDYFLVGVFLGSGEGGFNMEMVGGGEWERDKV